MAVVGYRMTYLLSNGCQHGESIMCQNYRWLSIQCHSYATTTKQGGKKKGTETRDVFPKVSPQ